MRLHSPGPRGGSRITVGAPEPDRVETSVAYLRDAMLDVLEDEAAHLDAGAFHDAVEELLRKNGRDPGAPKSSGAR